MKKLIIVTLACLSILHLSACTKADIEKMPVTIVDEAEDQSSPIKEENSTPQSDTDDTQESDETNNTDITDKGSKTDEDKNNPKDTSTDPSHSQMQPKSSYISEEAVKLAFELEGMKEEIDGSLYISSLGYQMVFDPERFTVTSYSSGIDSYEADNPNPDLYPYVFLTISQYDAPPEEKDALSEVENDAPIDKDKLVWDSIKVDSLDGYMNAEYMGDVKIGDYTAKHYKTLNGSEWNSVVKNYYQITYGKYIYLIDIQYFLEAAEGYGARIMAMLNTIEFE